MLHTNHQSKPVTLYTLKNLFYAPTMDLGGVGFALFVRPSAI